MTGRIQVFQEAMNQGHDAAWDQKWDRAASFYRQALEEFPNDSQALINLGLASIELQEYEEALQYYEQARQAVPDDPLPVEKIAQIHERLGNLELSSKASLNAAKLYLKTQEVNKAIENWMRVTQLDPANLSAHSHLALIYERIGKKEKAIQEYLIVASLLQEIGKIDYATNAVDLALKINPRDQNALQSMMMLRDFKPLPRPERPREGTAPLRMSQVGQLIAASDSKQMEKSLLDPIDQTCQEALTILAGVLFETADDVALERTDRPGFQDIVVGLGKNHKPIDQRRIQLHLSQVIDLQSRGELSQAAEELQRAIDVGLDQPAAYYDLGYLYYRLGRLESAIRLLQRAVMNADIAFGARLLLGDIYRQKGKWKDASIEYLEALKLADSQMIAPEWSSDLRHQYDPFIESYRQQSDEEMHQRLIDNATGLLMRSDWQEQVKRARAQLPGQDDRVVPRPLAEVISEARSSQVIEVISSIYEMKKRGRLKSAMEEAFYALDQAPTYLPLHRTMADLLVEEGNLQAAFTKFSTIAKTYSIRGESQQAIEMYRRIIELAPTDLTTRSQLIDMLVTSGQMEEAVKEKVQLAEVYISLADLLLARKTYMEALNISRSTDIELDLRLDILNRIADIDVQCLDWRQALRIYDQIRTMKPDDRGALANIIELNYRLGQEEQALRELDNFLANLSSKGREDQALSFLENLVAENPDRIPFRRRLSDLFRHLDLVEDAINQLDTIGELLLESGDRMGAIQTVETILSLNPPNKAAYQKLIEQLRTRS